MFNRIWFDNPVCIRPRSESSKPNQALVKSLSTNIVQIASEKKEKEKVAQLTLSSSLAIITFFTHLFFCHFFVRLFYDELMNEM